MSFTATVLNIQRMSTEDGPGIRTTVFFKGCSLACSWCHNPESISNKPQQVWHDFKCIGCRTCLEACPSSAITITEGGVFTDSEICTVCGTCAEECPTTAREILGTEWVLADLVSEVSKDKAFFNASTGGITASGGEPGVQASFVTEFLRECQSVGLHTALDTCGLVGTKALLQMAAHADLVLFDIKEIDPERHSVFTEHRNEKILENLGALRDAISSGDGPAELWIRTPLIPDATATEENITGIGNFIALNLRDVVTRWELCAFNNLCVNKYERLGLTWQFEDTPTMSKDELARFEEIARRSGVEAELVHVGGPTKVEKAND